MSRLKVLIYRIYDNLRGKHQWEEKTLIRWCTRCGWVEIDDPERGWTFYGFEEYDDTWMTWREQKKVSKELFEYLETEGNEDW